MFLSRRSITYGTRWPSSEFSGVRAYTPVIPAMNAKVVQVIIIPPHEKLDDPVQVRDRQAVRKPDPPPNCGMNIPQQELQLQQQRWALFDHHPDNSSPRARHAKACPRFVMGSSSRRVFQLVIWFG